MLKQISLCFLALLISPSLTFEIFPFIFLITTQIFFLKLFENKEIEILKIFINARQFNFNTLENVDVIQLNEKFELEKKYSVKKSRYKRQIVDFCTTQRLLIKIIMYYLKNLFSDKL